jgi:hypothetical protein
MSVELSLFQISTAELGDIESFLARKYERYEKYDDEYDNENIDCLELQGGLVEVLHFLLTSSSDFSGDWFSHSKQVVKELPILESEKNLVSIDALAGGTWLKPRDVCYLAPDQVQEIAQALSRMSQENLEIRWDLLSQFHSSERRKVIGNLERLQNNSKRLTQVVLDVAEFTAYFVNQFIAYYVGASKKGMGIIIFDHT